MRSIACSVLLAVTCSLSALEIPAEERPIFAMLDADLAEADRSYHISQAEAKETAIKGLEKLLKAEQQKKKISPLASDLEVRIEELRREAALLRDEPLLKANQIDEKIRKKEFTEDEWKAIPASIFTVDAKEPRNPTKFTVTAGQLYYVVPNPVDLWWGGVGDKLTWKGKADGWMKLVIMCGEKEIVDKLFVAETGPLNFGPHDNTCGDNTGAIRVKILRIH